MKLIQVAVAIATTLVLGAGLVWPGVMGVFLLPVALLYVVWAVRAALDHRFSIWLAFTSTWIVACFLGAFGVSMATHTFGANDGPVPLVVMDPTGNVLELPPEALPRIRQIQTEVDRRDRMHVSIFLLIAAGAWIVVGLHVVEWRWAFNRKPRE